MLHDPFKVTILFFTKSGYLEASHTSKPGDEQNYENTKISQIVDVLKEYSYVDVDIIEAILYKYL